MGGYFFSGPPKVWHPDPQKLSWDPKVGTLREKVEIGTQSWKSFENFKIFKKNPNFLKNFKIFEKSWKSWYGIPKVMLWPFLCVKAFSNETGFSMDPDNFLTFFENFKIFQNFRVFF